MSSERAPSNEAALTDLAARINAEHEACQSAMKKGLKHALEAGRLLLEGKAGLAHGQWLPWLKEHCPNISERSAQRYMRLADNRESLEAKSATVADLTLREAERAIAAPSDAGPGDPDNADDLSWAERCEKYGTSPEDREFLERCLGRMAWADYTIIRELGLHFREIRDKELFKPIAKRSGFNKANRVYLKGCEPHATFEEFIAAETHMALDTAENLIDVATALDHPRMGIQADILARMEHVAPGISVTPLGLHLPDDLTAAQWIDIGRLLSAMPGMPGSLTELADRAVWGED